MTEALSQQNNILSPTPPTHLEAHANLDKSYDTANGSTVTPEIEAFNEVSMIKGRDQAEIMNIVINQSTSRGTKSGGKTSKKGKK